MRLQAQKAGGHADCQRPYGERMMDVNAARKLLRGFGAAAAQSPMKQYIISSDEQFEEFYGMKADKKRKLYNGMLRCNLYMYYQPPEKRRPFRTAPTGKNRPQGGDRPARSGRISARDKNLALFSLDCYTKISRGFFRKRLQKNTQIARTGRITPIHNLFTKNFVILEKSTCVFWENDLIYIRWHSKVFEC